MDNCDDHYRIGGENWHGIVSCETLMTKQKRGTSLALNVIIIMMMVTLEVISIITMIWKIMMNMLILITTQKLEESLVDNPDFADHHCNDEEDYTYV